VTEYLNATKGTVSQSLKVLEKKGYIVKQADVRDRRVVHLILTAQGKKILEQVIPPPLFVNAVKGMTSKQLKDLEKQLAQLLISLQQANQLRSFGVCQTCHFFLKEKDGFRCGLISNPFDYP
jgi:DNA-binding MarR family transcriptional regulator